MAKTTITKNLTFSKVVAKKVAEIRADTGEKWAVLCARLINEEYDRRFNSPASAERPLPKQPAPAPPIVPFEDKGSQRVRRRKN